ncbi:hypothetical protein TSUD_138340 [Trifolium subterraneum]|uniref:Uncharacterized protein n=1 Tax=Trifolium subterraneum TaxID=3900 RepID=A0A2Z6MH87_TRISU|nr:hypothetical protein TSUD_138340 [Trifolium subterraneum]
MAENSDFIKPTIPKFDGFYEHWAMLMENLLRSKEYWNLIETGVTVAPANPTAEQQRVAAASKLTDLKVKNYLFQSIDRSILETILDRETSKDICDAMRRKYQGSSKVKHAQLQALRKEFEVLAMGESESIDEYFATTLTIANKMIADGERMEQVAVVEKILRSLTAKFNYVVCSIEEANDATALSIDGLQSSLIVQEQRMKSQQVSHGEQALKANNGGRGVGKGRGRGSIRGRGRENANYAEFLNEEETWFLDSGCSNHMGNVKLSIEGKVHIITEVFYIPGLKSNLLTIGQIQQGNVTIVFKDDACKIYHNDKGLLFSTRMSANKMYVVNATKDMVKGLPPLDELNAHCVDCLTSKQHRDAIPKQAVWRANVKLELVHSDICGPLNPKSNGGNRLMVEKESSCVIQILRTDRGGEFLSTTLNDFGNLGIKRQLTAAYTPQQNGVPERKNMTLLNMVRSMIAGRKVPKVFWPEAVKVFGCLPFVHVPDSQRTKLKDKSIQCVHLGVSDESKAYKLYDPVEKKIIVSRDVVFEENEGWNWDKNTVEDNNSQDIEDDIEERRTEPVENFEEIPQVSNETGVHNGTNETTHIDDRDENMYVLDTSSDEGSTSQLPPRIIRTPAKLRDYVTGSQLEEEEAFEDQHNLAIYTPSDDPKNFVEANKLEIWRKAMDQEMESIENNETWQLTTLPEGSNAIGVKWFYKTKYNEKGEVEKHKARLVAKGYSQRHGVDYNEVFAPVARWDTIRVILALAAKENWKVFQLHVKSAFLHGELTEDIYVEQALGYPKGNENNVYKLKKKTLYGLKQAPRAWYSKIETYFTLEQFEKCSHEHTLFVKYGSNSKILIVSLYVDDLICTGNDVHMIYGFKESMKKLLAMTDLGSMKYFLGVEVIQSNSGIFIHQHKYATEILKRFGMENCNKVCSPIVPGCKLVKDENGNATDARKFKQMVGCLMYLLATGPDLACSICLVARFMDRPTEMHIAAIKRIMRYLKGTLTDGIMYKHTTDTKLELVGWSDLDYAGDLDDKKSTSDYVPLVEKTLFTSAQKHFLHLTVKQM